MLPNSQNYFLKLTVGRGPGSQATFAPLPCCTNMWGLVKGKIAISPGNGNWEMLQQLKEIAFQLGIRQYLCFKDRQLFGYRAGWEGH